MQNDACQTIRQLAALAGIPLSEERIAALTPALPFVRAGLAALARVDYGKAEPAGRFRPRPQARQ